MTFVNPAPTEVDPGLRTHAYYKLKDGTWKDADWTGRDEVEFCRKTEDVRRVILVHSTTTRPQGGPTEPTTANTDKAKLKLARNCDPSNLFDPIAAYGTFDWDLREEFNDFPCVDQRRPLGSGLAPGSEPATFWSSTTSDPVR